LLFSRAVPAALVFAACSSLCAPAARAGAGFFVDDAAIAPAGRCQVESWARARAPGAELAVVPACNFAGTELSLGYGFYNRPASGTLWTPAIKRLWRDVDAHRWGLGVSAGATWDSAASRWTDGSVNLPLSVALGAERGLRLHANLGWIRYAGGRDGATGGVGLELALGPWWSLLAETHDDRRGPVAAQLGLRRAFNDAASLDLAVGQQGSRRDAWLSLGFNLAFSR